MSKGEFNGKWKTQWQRSLQNHVSPGQRLENPRILFYPARISFRMCLIMIAMINGNLSIPITFVVDWDSRLESVFFVHEGMKNVALINTHSTLKVIYRTCCFLSFFIIHNKGETILLCLE